ASVVVLQQTTTPIHLIIHCRHLNMSERKGLNLHALRVIVGQRGPCVAIHLAYYPDVYQFHHSRVKKVEPLTRAFFTDLFQVYSRSLTVPLSRFTQPVFHICGTTTHAVLYYLPSPCALAGVWT